MTDVPAPGWKGQPDDTEREPTPCLPCEGLGFLWNQTYGEADIPDEFIPVQACDACQAFADDEAAARSAADYYAYPEVRFFGSFWLASTRGDWAVGHHEFCTPEEAQHGQDG